MAKEIIIVGGGASGLVAGIVAARKGAKVIILERKNRVGKKILATGNGRCNISNERISIKDFHSDSKNIFPFIYSQFDLQATQDFFAKLGVETLSLEEGKLYPFSLQATSVLNVLREELEHLKVTILCNQQVTSVHINHQVMVQTRTDEFYGDRLILATGGRAMPNLGSNGSGYRLAKQLDLPMTPIYPSLVQLESDYKYLKHLKGTKVMATVSIMVKGHKKRTEYGELLFTEYGVSGPPILQLSRHAGKQQNFSNQLVELQIDLLPQITKEALDQLLKQRQASLAHKTLEKFFVGLLPKQLIVPLIKDTHLHLESLADSLKEKDIEAMIDWLKALTISITGTKKWEHAQITAGGVDCRSVLPETLRSKRHESVYLCGELLDIDGDCGGFNLQWAWSSGYVAGFFASQEA